MSIAALLKLLTSRPAQAASAWMPVNAIAHVPEFAAGVLGVALAVAVLLTSVADHGEAVIAVLRSLRRLRSEERSSSVEGADVHPAERPQAHDEEDK